MSRVSPQLPIAIKIKRKRIFSLHKRNWREIILTPRTETYRKKETFSRKNCLNKWAQLNLRTIRIKLTGVSPPEARAWHADERRPGAGAQFIVPGT